MPNEQLPRTTVPAPAKASISTPVISCWPAEARSSERRAATWSMSSIVPKPMARGLSTLVMNCAAVLARLALVGRDLVDAEILVDEGIAGDLAVIVDQAGDHLDQRRLAGAGRAVADEGEQEAAELDERVQLALEIIGHHHLGELDRLVLGDVVADDLFRLLEGHHQRLRLLAGRDVEAVDGEAVAVDPDMRFLEMADAVEAALAAEQPVDRHAGEGARPGHQVGVVLDAGDRPVEAGDQRLQRILRGIEQEVGLGDVVRRLALAVDQLQQIGRKAEGRNVSRCRQQLLEGRGLVAFERRARILGLQRFEVAAAREHVGDGQRDRQPAAGAEQQRVLADRHQRIVGMDRRHRLGKLDLAGAAHRAGRHRRHEAAAGAGERRAGLAAGILQHHDARDHALRHRAMLLDVGFVDRGQTRVHAANPPVKRR